MRAIASAGCAHGRSRLELIHKGEPCFLYHFNPFAREICQPRSGQVPSAMSSKYSRWATWSRQIGTKIQMPQQGTNASKTPPIQTTALLPGSPSKVIPIAIMIAGDNMLSSSQR
ncbi:hypothetical protein [Paraburkholderia ginsengiterrae]|uniref:hypothetical protein n=1 Tax=Paraburkholderia ginsengiterrae TaxID=1462993 RepID=UPI0010427604|nr:hypothetical protein [Paraburkholderia ginsengiterrae]